MRGGCAGGCWGGRHRGAGPRCSVRRVALHRAQRCPVGVTRSRPGPRRGRAPMAVGWAGVPRARHRGRGAGRGYGLNGSASSVGAGGGRAPVVTAASTSRLDGPQHPPGAKISPDGSCSGRGRGGLDAPFLRHRPPGAVAPWLPVPRRWGGFGARAGWEPGWMQVSGSLPTPPESLLRPIPLGCWDQWPSGTPGHHQPPAPVMPGPGLDATTDKRSPRVGASWDWQRQVLPAQTRCQAQ